MTKLADIANRTADAVGNAQRQAGRAFKGWEGVRREARRRWLRVMKSLVAEVDRLPRGRGVALRGLSHLPAGWTASAALSDKIRRRDPSTAERYAIRAIRDNPGVWQGHHQHVLALESAGRAEEARIARATAAALMGPASVEIAAHRWLGELSMSREDVIRACLDSSEDEAKAVAMIIRLGGREFAAGGLTRMVEVLGPQVLADPGEIEKVIPPGGIAELVHALRQGGAVEIPLRLLERYPPVEPIEREKRGVVQDMAALEGQLKLEFLADRRLDPRPATSLYLLHNALPQSSGGYANRSHGLLQGLRAQNVEAIPVTRPGFPSVNLVFDQDPTAPSVDVVDGIIYHHLLGEVTSQPRSDLQGFVDLYRDRLGPLVEEYRPAVIHGASNWWNGFGAVATARQYGLPSVYEVRGLWEITRSSRISGWDETERYLADTAYEAEAARLADRVIVITGGLRDELVRRGVPEDKITVVPNAVDTDKFRVLERDESLAEELGLGDEVVIGFAGTLTFYEGLDDLLRAGAMVAKQSDTPFSFLFVGDGPVREDLESLAESLDLQDSCRFVGRVKHSEVSRYLSVMDITPFPRKPLPVCEMVSPLKPLESMASGATVLASDVSALKEMIPLGTGLTFAKGDVSDLAEMLRAIVEDASLREKLSTNGRRWVENERNWTVVSKTIAQLYQEIESGAA